MTAATSVKVEGADRLARTLDAFADGLTDLDDVNGAIAARVLADARRRAPVRSGRLASSGFSTSTGTAAVVGFSARHAGPIQFGVGPRVGLRGPHNIRPNPFATDALAADERVAVDMLAAELDDRLGDVKGA